MVLEKLKRTQKVKGGEIISRMLAGEGVERVFGIIDGTYIGLYSTFEPNGIQLVGPRHETSAAHMAGAYARVTGKLGVCIASNGPGVANILSGIAVENAEGNRVLLITSSRREGIAGPDRVGTFQYFPHAEAIRPISKWAETVPSIERLGELTRKALSACYTGRPGVVHLDVPESIMNSSYELDPSWIWPAGSYRPTAPQQAGPAQIAAAAKLLAGAKRPLIHAGTGVAHCDAGDELLALAALIEAPITTSWGARCAVDERDEHVVPMIYIDAVNRARNEADLVLVLGSRLGETDWWGKAPYWARPDQQQLIQVDIDTQTIGSSRPVALGIQADAKAFLTALVEHLSQGWAKKGLASRAKWVAGLQADCVKRRAELDTKLDDKAVPMAPAHVPATCRALFADDAILVIDGGNTSVWTNFFHEVRAQHTVLGTSKMGMLGAGVGQALGAAVAHPDRQVYCIIGDGAFGMHQQEIETAVRNGLRVTFLVLCDKQWGMVKMTQQIAFKPLKTLVFKSLEPHETINADLGETRFDDLARAMGAHGERVADPEGLPGAIKRSLSSGKCAVIHVDVDPVKHMWAPELRTFKAMHAEPEG